MPQTYISFWTQSLRSDLFLPGLMLLLWRSGPKRKGCTTSDSWMVRVEPSEVLTVKVLSLSASHTNWTLRLVASRASHDSAELRVNGALSLEQVKARDAVFAEHVELGLNWRVIAKEVAEAFPSVLQLVQAAQNATLQKSESELLRRIFSLAKTMHRQTFNPFARWPCLRNPLVPSVSRPCIQFCSPLLRGHRGKLFAGDRDFRTKFRAHSGPGPCILGSAFPRLQARARADPLSSDTH